MKRQSSAAADLKFPAPSESEKEYEPKIVKIVDEIAKLTLLEVTDLNECLKVILFNYLILSTS